MPWRPAISPMKKIVVYAALIGAAGALAFYGSIHFAASVDRDFWSTTLQNFAGEMIGAALTIAGAYWLTLRVARKKITPLSPAVTAVLQDLRTQGRLSPEATRASVVAVVTVMNKGDVNAGVPADVVFRAPSCRVCGLRTEKDPDKPRCLHCKLPKPMWVDATSPAGSSLDRR